MAERTPTKEEIEASVALSQAEAAQHLAEAEHARKQAELVELELRVEREKDESRRAGDEFHHVYRFTSEVSPASVASCQKKLTEWARRDPYCDIEVIFFSPGGEIFSGMALFDTLRDLSRQGHKITTGANGMAASMAGILLQAGDHRWMTRQCWVLIHRASYGAVGSSYEIEDKAKHIARIEKRIIEIFTTRSGGALTARKIRNNWNRQDWWLDSDEAMTLGVVDEIRG